MYCLFTELVRLEVVLTQITDLYIWVFKPTHSLIFLRDCLDILRSCIITLCYLPYKIPQSLSICMSTFLEISYHVFLYNTSSSLNVLKQRINAQITFLSRCSSCCVYLEIKSSKLLLSPATTTTTHS